MNIEKVKQIAREKYGKELTDAEAAGYAEKYGHVSDEELDNVVGGGCTVTVDNYYPDPTVRPRPDPAFNPRPDPNVRFGVGVKIQLK